MKESPGKRVALVTGGGRGIGKTISQSLAENGWHVVLFGRSLVSLEKTRDAIEGSGGSAECQSIDVTDGESVKDAIDRLHARFGRVDLLVNNAGIYGSPQTALLDYEPESWWKVFEVNVRGTFLLISACLPGMVAAASGCIINIGSYAAIGPSPGATAYAASKAAICRMTDSLAVELTGTGVRVFTVSPGFVRTDMSARLPQAASLPEDRWDAPELVAQLCIRLAKEDAAILSGSFIHVRDDLEEMIEQAERISAGSLYRLALPKLDGFARR